MSSDMLDDAGAREEDILFTPDDVAMMMRVSRRTVSTWRYRLLRKLEQCNHAGARDFWAHLRVGSLAHMAADLETMMLRVQEVERGPHQA